MPLDEWRSLLMAPKYIAVLDQKNVMAFYTKQNALQHRFRISSI